MDMEKAESNALNLDVSNLRADSETEMEKMEQRVQVHACVTQRLNKIKQALTDVTRRLNRLEGDIEKLEEGNLKLTQMTSERNSAVVALMISSATG